MATLAQLHANRINAQHSSGPSSVEGKTAIRFNAMKHGIDAESLVIPGEDPDELAQLAHDMFIEHRPQGALETMLVRNLVQADWARRRYARIEAQLYGILIKKQEDSELANPAGAFYADAASSKTMDKLFRRQQAAQRDFNRALDDIRRIQQARREVAMEQAMEDAMSRSPFESRPAPDATPNPAPTAPPDSPGVNRVCSEPPSCRL